MNKVLLIVILAFFIGIALLLWKFYFPNTDKQLIEIMIGVGSFLFVSTVIYLVYRLLRYLLENFSSHHDDM